MKFIRILERPESLVQELGTLRGDGQNLRELLTISFQLCPPSLETTISIFPWSRLCETRIAVKGTFL